MLWPLWNAIHSALSLSMVRPPDGSCKTWFGCPESCIIREYCHLMCLSCFRSTIITISNAKVQLSWKVYCTINFQDGQRGLEEGLLRVCLNCLWLHFYYNCTQRDMETMDLRVWFSFYQSNSKTKYLPKLLSCDLNVRDLSILVWATALIVSTGNSAEDLVSQSNKSCLEITSPSSAMENGSPCQNHPPRRLCSPCLQNHILPSKMCHAIACCKLRQAHSTLEYRKLGTEPT